VLVRLHGATDLQEQAALLGREPPNAVLVDQ
jgi:hypothetical protein